MTTQEKENYLKQFSKGTFYTIAVTEWFSSCGTTYRFVGTNGKLTPLKPNLAFLGCAMEFKTKADAEKKAKELMTKDNLPSKDAWRGYISISITDDVATYSDSRKRISIVEIDDETYLRWKLGERCYKYMTNGENDNAPIPTFKRGDLVVYYDYDMKRLYKSEICDLWYIPENNTWYYQFGFGIFSSHINESLLRPYKQALKVFPSLATSTYVGCYLEDFNRIAKISI